MINAERKEIIDYIIDKVTKKGHLKSSIEIAKKYEFILPYCTLGILKPNQENLDPVIEIAENFGNPVFRARTAEDRAFYGVRKLYRGGYDGLDEVALQGINGPNSEGKVLPPAEKLLRSKEWNNDFGLTNPDLYLFDAFLKYAQRELYNLAINTPA